MSDSQFGCLTFLHLGSTPGYCTPTSPGILARCSSAFQPIACVRSLGGTALVNPLLNTSGEVRADMKTYPARLILVALFDHRQSRRSKNCRDFPAAAFAESTSRFTAKANIRGAIIGRECALTEDGNSNQPCGFAKACLASSLP